jgi:putative ATP-binding cassette transporter
MSWFINSYATLAEWRATVNRLREFRDLLDAPPAEAGAIDLHLADGGVVETRGLQLTLPNGQPLARVPDLRIARGEHWLVRGPSGAGKSTLLRALSGLWHFGNGTIVRPSAHVLFVPQRSYLPLGSLRAALAYPGAAADHADAAYQEVLSAVGLASLTGSLDEEAHWSNRLSPGEQQRLAFARVLLQRPELLVLDEATSALDPAAEHALYTLLLERLPEVTLISVAHREALQAFHPHTVELVSADKAAPPMNYAPA